jgi:hypothetical protein
MHCVTHIHTHTQAPDVHVIDALACSIDRDARTATVSFLLPPDSLLGGLPLESTLAVLVHMDSGFFPVCVEGFRVWGLDRLTLYPKL